MPIQLLRYGHTRKQNCQTSRRFHCLINGTESAHSAALQCASSSNLHSKRCSTKKLELTAHKSTVLCKIHAREAKHNYWRTRNQKTIIQTAECNLVVLSAGKWYIYYFCIGWGAINWLSSIIKTSWITTHSTENESGSWSIIDADNCDCCMLLGRWTTG